jgi:hypothetical protein
MENGDAWVLPWRRFIVDASTGAATAVVVFAAAGVLRDVLFALLTAGALVGVAWMLERRS